MNTLRTINTAALAIAAATCTLLGTPAVSLAVPDASAQAAKYGCQGCHAVDKKIHGPSYKDVAAKYAGDSDATAKLEKKIKNGGSGVWGAIPMPPNNVPDADLKTLVEWILASK